VRINQQNGSVTAELAVTLPVVGFMLAVIVGVFGMQVQRLQLLLQQQVPLARQRSGP
jgi:hypothetical protein